MPTWNYVAVHASGPLEFFNDSERLRALLGALSDRFEAGRPHPWSIDDAPADYLTAQLGAVVGFRLAIERLEGKWKLSQNRGAADRAGVIAGLRADGEDAVADAMEGS